MEQHIDEAIKLLTVTDNIYQRTKVMYYAASKPKCFMDLIADIKPDVMLMLEKRSGVGEEPVDYMSYEWDEWHDRCTATIENALIASPSFLAIIGMLPIPDITDILGTLEGLEDAFTSMNIN